jgi:hypothetical protein
MRKSTTIAQCLVNSKMIWSLEEAETAVKVIYIEEFPSRDFNDWNRDINEDVAANIIRTVGQASRINVKKFIEDLW